MLAADAQTQVGTGLTAVMCSHLDQLADADLVQMLERRTKNIPYMRYDKAKLPEFYLQEENLEKIIAEMG